MAQYPSRVSCPRGLLVHEMFIVNTPRAKRPSSDPEQAAYADSSTVPPTVER